MRALVLILLGSDAGLRTGENMALRWCDVDFRRRQIVIEQAGRHGVVDVPKSGHGPIVPMTEALASVLPRARHLGGGRVLYRDDAAPVVHETVRAWLEPCERRAPLEVEGSLHRLRHTFCSHLAMRGSSEGFAAASLQSETDGIAGAKADALAIC